MAGLTCCRSDPMSPHRSAARADGCGMSNAGTPSETLQPRPAADGERRARDAVDAQLVGLARRSKAGNIQARRQVLTRIVEITREGRGLPRALWEYWQE